MKNKYLQLRFLETGYTIASLKRATGLAVATISDTMNNKIDVNNMTVNSYNAITSKLYTDYERYLLETSEKSEKVDSEFPIEVYALFKDRLSSELLHLLINHPDDLAVQLYSSVNEPIRVKIVHNETWGFEREFWIFENHIISLLIDKDEDEMKNILKNYCFEDLQNRHG